VEDCSQWTEIISAPAFAKSATRCSGSTIICRAGIGQSEIPGVVDHQMTVEDFVCYWSEGIYDQGSNCDVGNEASVHDIDMDPVAACFVNCFDL